MLIAGIHVSLGPYADDPIKVMNVDMDKHPEESRQDLTAHRGKGSGKWHVRGDREDVLIVDLRLCPVHQQLNVSGSWQLCRFLVRFSIRP